MEINMKIILKVINTLILTALFVSCTDDSSKSNLQDDQDHSSHVSDTPEEGLRLNNGQKWMMDDHTRSSFIRMTTSFLNTDHLSMEVEVLKKSGSDLQVQIGELIKGCTMTGEAHDQLHVYLMGYMPAVDALSKSGQMEDAKKVKHYLEIYDDYFE
jgi:hypothetical protein